MIAGSGRKAFTELIVTMFPPPRCTRCGSAALVVRTAANRLRVSADSQSSSVMDSKPPRCGWTLPTLLTRMSSPPNVLTASSINRAGPSAAARSIGTA